MAIIRTVCGDIAPQELGFTSFHEHTIFDQTKLRDILENSLPEMKEGAVLYNTAKDILKEQVRRKLKRYPKVPKRDLDGVMNGFFLPEGHPGLKLSNLDYYVNELEEFKKVGGQSLCDCSMIPTIDSYQAMKELSEKTGVHIVTTAGFYTRPSLPEEIKNGTDEFVMETYRDYALKGDRYGTRPGILKAAIASLEEGGKVAKEELKCVRAGSTVAKELGMPFIIHTAFPIRKEHLAFAADMMLNEVGVDPSRVEFCHIDDLSLAFDPAAHICRDGYDIEFAKILLDRGFNIGLDTWSVTMDNDEIWAYAKAARKAMLRELDQMGVASQILFGHDFTSRTAGTQNGRPGYTQWPTTLQQMVADGELSEDFLRQAAVDNPARILSIEE